MIGRYVQAFLQALKLTLRGQAAPPPKFAPLRAWMQQSLILVDALAAAADTAGLDVTARKAFVLRIEGRDVNMHTMLATLKYHLQEEYPYLLRHETEHSLTALYAANMNDRFWAARLAQQLSQPAAQAAAAALAAHLEAIPPPE